MESVPVNDGIIEFSFAYVISVRVNYVGEQCGQFVNTENVHSYVVGQPWLQSILSLLLFNIYRLL